MRVEGRGWWREGERGAEEEARAIGRQGALGGNGAGECGVLQKVLRIVVRARLTSDMN